MGDLMIADRECTTRESFQVLSKRTVARHQVSVLPKDAIEIYRIIDLHMRVFVDHPNGGSHLPRGLEYRLACGVELTDNLLPVTSSRSESLRLVVEMGKVNERKVWP